jgi:hypothetical protein
MQYGSTPVDVLYLPQVTESDYPALRDIILGQRPYAEWLQLAADWREYWGGQGCKIQPVSVKAADFCQYLDARGFPYDLNQLLGFAEWVGKGRKA